MGSGAADFIGLRRVPVAGASLARPPVVTPAILSAATEIVEDVRIRGEAAVRELAERFDGVGPEDPLTRSPADLLEALESIDPDARGVLERTAGRIEAFARAQLATTRPTSAVVPGGTAGDRLVPVGVAGCYAPGGRFPLPSSVLMTAVTARVAGVSQVWVASPRPTPEVLAAAAVAGVDGFLAVGGAHAIAALAHGVGPLPRCDVVVGPGSQWVTAAKLLLSGTVGIDLLAGPSELVVLSDGDGSPALIAADLLAQAEHAPDALPVLVSTSSDLLDAVDRELAAGLETLPTARVARAALAGGFAVLAASADEALECCQRLAPEHVQLHGGSALEWSERLDRYGGLFVGEDTAEVLGDYGMGPNHTLPTGGTARFASGLSVFSFLRRPTWLRVEASRELDDVATDAAALARVEGLEAHARAAEMRIRGGRSTGPAGGTD